MNLFKNLSVFPSLNFKSSRGFTLVEMMVVVGIVSILLAVILGGQSRYSDRLNLKNQAYNLALKIRQAQVNSLGVVSGSTGSQNFNVSYGVSFQTASNNSFVFFTDKDFNGRYDSGELLETVSLGGNVTSSNYCGTNGSGVEDCSTPQLRTIEITFRRPNPSAVVQYRNAGGQLIGSLYAPARIELQSASGSQKMSIKIDSTGQVSIQ